MTTHKETAAVAGTTTTATKSNCEAAQTTNTTVQPRLGRNGQPLIFHIIHAKKGGSIRTVCGKAFPTRRAVTATSETQREHQECSTCRWLYELNEELKASLQAGEL